jgi:alpha-L-rhamnosidase
MMALLHKRMERPDMLLPESPHSPYNDWLNPTGVNLTPRFFAGCWFLHMLDTLSKIAEIIGKKDVAKELHERFQKGKAEFCRRHFNAATHRFDEDIQCAYVLTVAFHIVPTDARKPCIDRLAQLIQTEGHQTTGFQGTRHLFDVLSEGGYANLAVQLLERTEFPSWMDMLKGLTSVPESWHGNRDPDQGISMSHFSYGSCIAWFFEYLGGFKLEKCQPGLKKVWLEPHAIQHLGHCDVRYRTPYGEIRSAWSFQDGTPHFEYHAPPEVEVEFHPQVL